MNKNLIFAIILGVLLLVSVVQAVQLTSLKSKIDANAVKIGSSKPATQTGTAGSGLNDLPTMVGGC
ncbi:hypothetical protein HYY74_05805 [Candidatus Woesearchaeota archaeon]|nr:hypothetical protein [Candidatus Woesearchaeota archaeon]